MRLCPERGVTFWEQGRGLVLTALEDFVRVRRRTVRGWSGEALRRRRRAGVCLRSTCAASSSTWCS